MTSLMAATAAAAEEYIKYARPAMMTIDDLPILYLYMFLVCKWAFDSVFVLYIYAVAVINKTGSRMWFMCCACAILKAIDSSILWVIFFE